MGTSVHREYIEGFDHIFPNDVSGHEYMNPEVECSDPSFHLYGAGSNYCQVDMAGNFLNYLYGDLNPRVFDQDIHDKGLLAVIDQSNFTNSIYEDSYLLDHGFIYIPYNCLQNIACDVHIHFHGCVESSDIWGSLYIRQNGILEHAAANDIIVIYPQNGDLRTNPLIYCWYSGFATGITQQVHAIQDLVKSIFDCDLFTEDCTPSARL